VLLLASFWKPPTSEAHPRNAVSGKARRAAFEASQPGLPTANCQAKCWSCRDKQGFDQAQAKHNHKQANNAIVAVQRSTVQQ
jgi:hypothetical protein